jgi:hypothetical protein
MQEQNKGDSTREQRGHSSILVITSSSTPQPGVGFHGRSAYVVEGQLDFAQPQI